MTWGNAMNVMILMLRRRYLALAWSVCVLLLLGLGSLRVATEAEYTYASAIIVPILWLTWAGGSRHGVLAALLGAGMWLLSDLMSAARFSEAWIPYSNALTRLLTYLTLVYLGDWLGSALIRERQLASHDFLTGILNRRAFYEAGQAETSRARRHHRPLALALLDLDDFKALNDRYGHATGDAALKVVAICLTASTRESDHVVRLGGDEFAVLLPEVELAGAEEIGRKFMQALDSALAPFPLVSASIGVAWFPEPPANFRDMIRCADAVMYEVKESGKRGMKTRTFRPDASGELAAV